MGDTRNILIAVVLAILAWVPWATVVADLFAVLVLDKPMADYIADRGANYSGVGSTWQIYWHWTMLLMFGAILLRSKRVERRRKFLWAFGLLFFWPIVSLLLIWHEFLGASHEPGCA